MKNALILHATGNNSQGNWYSWLQSELGNKGYKVWLPDLPGADKPNIQRYNEFIFANKEWSFDSDSLVIGHSSGAVAALGLLQNLPEGGVIDKCILVSVFENDLGWDKLKDLFIEPLDFEKLKNKARKFIVLHSDNDPYCPIEGARNIAEKLGAEFVIKEQQGHFNLEVGEQYRQFPFLLSLI